MIMVTRLKLLSAILAIVFISPHRPGSTHDLAMFRERLQFHLSMTKKTEDEKMIEDHGEGLDRFAYYWAILMDKGYIGASCGCRAITPTKAPQKGQLTPEASERNDRIASDRVLVENFLGRVCNLWQCMQRTWRWHEDSFDDAVVVCFALTNYHIQLHLFAMRKMQLIMRRLLLPMRPRFKENSKKRRTREQDTKTKEKNMMEMEKRTLECQLGLTVPRNVVNHRLGRLEEQENVPISVSGPNL
eukprot:TRINITY_DN3814_c0_g1_i2.p1 TRINITY_DN3814_c0_g1~~TRINITY_DN3814_c0_g1_i2.p1  ORF type:complete len:244 (-),score=46.31 TRINITY_DN3814_c0_g1_i2:28-759(-)